MKHRIEHIKNILFAIDQDLPFEHSMVISATVFGIIICLIATILPIIFYSSISAIFAPAMFSVVLSIFYYYFRFEFQYTKFIRPLIMVILVSLSYLWIFIVGINGTIDLFLVTILILTLIIVPNNHKRYLLLIYLGLVTVLFAIEYYVPMSIFKYKSREDLIIDKYIAVITNSYIVYFVIKVLNYNYTKERLKVEEKEQILKELNSTKDKFFSIIAHDLRNPLYGFREMSSMLYDNYNHLDAAELKEYLELLKNSSNSIFALLENLLEWSRSQQGLIHFNPIDFNLSFIVNNCIELLNLSATKKRILILNKISDSLTITADPNLITTVIRNLLSNAIKFTPVDGEIEIGMLSVDSKSYNTIYIKDSGIGMTQEIMDKLFKIDKSITSKGTVGETGTGLGLILCREFVEKHNGKIWVESEVGWGSTFYFTLPSTEE